MYDMKKLGNLAALGQHAGEAFQAFQAFDKAAFAAGALSVKQKELIAVAVALTTQCAYCIEVHKQKAIAAGASEAELAETIMVAAAIRAGGAVAHGAHVVGG